MKKKNWQDMEQIEIDFAEWLVKNKVNESIGILIDTCAEYMDKPFYEWYHDGCSYDDSGRLKDIGKTVKECCHTLQKLLSAYTGSSIPTHLSRMGISWETIEEEYRRRLVKRIFENYLLEYIAINQKWLLSFDDINGAITDEDKRYKLGIKEDCSINEAIKEYIWFEDVVGWSVVDLEEKVEEIIQSIPDEIYEQIQQQAEIKNTDGIGEN